jgi:hypothetical protein
MEEIKGMKKQEKEEEKVCFSKIRLELLVLSQLRFAE